MSENPFYDDFWGEDYRQKYENSFEGLMLTSKTKQKSYNR